MTDEEAMEALLNSGVYSFPTWTLKLGLCMKYRTVILKDSQFWLSFFV